MTDYFEPAVVGVRPCALEWCSGAADGSGLCPACLPLFGRYREVLLHPEVVEEWDPGWTVEKLSHGDAADAPTSTECSMTS